MTRIIATNDDVNARACGTITWWELSGYASHAQLTEAWEAAGLPDNLAPRRTGAVAALKRALNNTVGHELIRSLGAQGSWAIVHERRIGRGAGATLEYTVQAHVCLTEATRDDSPRQLEWEFEDSDWTEEMQDAIAAAIEAEYLEQLDLVSHSEVSSWLIGLCKYGLDGLGLRERGGMYYLPKTSLDMWGRVASVLHDHTGHKIKRIPALTSEDAIEAITDAILAEADQLLDGVSELLADPDAGKRALGTRKGYLERMLGKLGTYDSMLGSRLDAVRSRVVQAQSKVVRAELKIETANAKAA